MIELGSPEVCWQNRNIDNKTISKIRSSSAQKPMNVNQISADHDAAGDCCKQVS